MKFTLKYDIQQDMDDGQVDVVIQVIHGTTISDTIELVDTTSNLVALHTRKTIEDLFEEMANARRDNRANAGAESTASAGATEEG
jgi:hypothetical protein